MVSRISTAVLLGAALFTSPLPAQTTAPRSNTTSTAHKEGEWRSSKVIGVNVYNEANEKLGEIEEIIIDKSGRVTNVILGVGGFLGMGEHYVAVDMSKLRWVNEPVRSTTTAPSTSTPPANKPTVATTDKGAVTGEVNRSNRPMRASNETWYPDHAIYNATKDQLKNLPQFKYN
jgi:sporulation protein YlmC with PRC-barrel domain